MADRKADIDNELGGVTFIPYSGRRKTAKGQFERNRQKSRVFLP